MKEIEVDFCSLSYSLWPISCSNMFSAVLQCYDVMCTKVGQQLGQHSHSDRVVFLNDTKSEQIVDMVEENDINWMLNRLE